MSQYNKNSKISTVDIIVWFREGVDSVLVELIMNVFDEVNPEWEFAFDVVFEFSETGESLADEIEQLLETGRQFRFLLFGRGRF